MSSHSHSSRSDVKEEKHELGDKSQSRRSRKSRLAEQNNNYRRDYPPLVIPPSFYNVVHVHQFTPMNVITTLIHHFESCCRFSIDTESDRFTYDLSLIQVHSIPEQLPSFVVLFELNHFPKSDSTLLRKIKTLFSLLFRLGNIIFSWGSMSEELKYAVGMQYFTWPVPALLIDLQIKFPKWYRGAQSLCKACRPIQSSNMSKSSKLSCSCFKVGPYVNINDKWSLQNAIIYTIGRFLDKSSTLKEWSVLLDPEHSPLSSFEQRKRIKYAVYDCLSITYLHQAIYEEWTLTKLREAELTDLFTSNAPSHLSLVSSSSGLEDISEDESDTQSKSLFKSNVISSILLEDISEDEDEDDLIIAFLSNISRADKFINTFQHVEPQLFTTFSDDFTELVSSKQQQQQLFTNEPPPPRRIIRSLAARKRRNLIRNMIKRLRRDKHIIFRQCYYKFKHYQMKKILHSCGVKYFHLKFYKSLELLSIGMKNEQLVDIYFDRIPGDLFTEDRYVEFRRQEYRQRHHQFEHDQRHYRHHRHSAYHQQRQRFRRYKH